MRKLLVTNNQSLFIEVNNQRSDASLCNVFVDYLFHFIVLIPYSKSLLGSVVVVAFVSCTNGGDYCLSILLLNALNGINDP